MRRAGTHDNSEGRTDSKEYNHNNDLLKHKKGGEVTTFMPVCLKGNNQKIFTGFQLGYTEIVFLNSSKDFGK